MVELDISYNGDVGDVDADHDIFSSIAKPGNTENEDEQMDEEALLSSQNDLDEDDAKIIGDDLEMENDLIGVEDDDEDDQDDDENNHSNNSDSGKLINDEFNHTTSLQHSADELIDVSQDGDISVNNANNTTNSSLTTMENVHETNDQIQDVDVEIGEQQNGEEETVEMEEKTTLVQTTTSNTQQQTVEQITTASTKPVPILPPAPQKSDGDKVATLRHIFSDACYFLIKSSNEENVSLAKAKGVWSTPPANEAKLNRAFKEHRNVILIYSVAESKAFQGFARMSCEARHDSQPINWVLPPGMSNRAFSGIIRIDWVTRRSLPFGKTSHLYNSWNDNKPVKIGRDGQEIEPRCAESLCRLFPSDPNIDILGIALKAKRNKKTGSKSKSRTPPQSKLTTTTITIINDLSTSSSFSTSPKANASTIITSPITPQKSSSSRRKSLNSPERTKSPSPPSSSLTRKTSSTSIKNSSRTSNNNNHHHSLTRRPLGGATTIYSHDNNNNNNNNNNNSNHRRPDHIKKDYRPHSPPNNSYQQRQHYPTTTSTGARRRPSSRSRERTKEDIQRKRRHRSSSIRSPDPSNRKHVQRSPHSHPCLDQTSSSHDYMKHFNVLTTHPQYPGMPSAMFPPTAYPMAYDPIGYVSQTSLNHLTYDHRSQTLPLSHPSQMNSFMNQAAAAQATAQYLQQQPRPNLLYEQEIAEFLRQTSHYRSKDGNSNSGSHKRHHSSREKRPRKSRSPRRR
ncbi:unnamed protein product [Didymodactylos carnosus]|uniref:YTH domain-containing protein n=1 Tax=Didymodactylos carnosus TaxID=1234261 RepID=A0A814GPJ2_9BILA|nr:unnamed protein product [Didymodactylos carnosus]CAF3770607.1 unnamed protein product [Didymodactylos carnosus]